MENQETALQLSNQSLDTTYFGNKDAFEHVQRVAKMFSSSNLVPEKYRNNIGNCVIALEMANRMKISPLMVMQHLGIIMGRPAWSSTFLIASLNACGKFSPIRYEEDGENGGRTRAWAYDNATKEKIYGAWVSMEMAQAEGWVSKSGSKWKTMPELMRRYRAASFFTKQYAPEISMGFQTAEEIIDAPPAEEQRIPAEEDLQLLLDMKRDALTDSEKADADRIIANKEQNSYRKLHNLLMSK